MEKEDNLYAYLGVEMEAIIAFPVVEVVGSEMLAASCHLQHVLGLTVWLLEASYVAGCIFACKKWVLSWGLLSSAPPWVTEYIDIWAPVCQPAHATIVHCTSLI